MTLAYFPMSQFMSPWKGLCREHIHDKYDQELSYTVTRVIIRVYAVFCGLTG